MESIYTNSISSEVNIYDICLVFGLRNESSEFGDPLARVYMSPQHAKVLSKILAQNIEVYEQKFGTIPLPDDLKFDILEKVLEK